MKSHLPGGNKEFESTIGKSRDLKVKGITANGGLEDLTNRRRIKTKLAAAKCHDQGKR